MDKREDAHITVMLELNALLEVSEKSVYAMKCEVFS